MSIKDKFLAFIQGVGKKVVPIAISAVSLFAVGCGKNNDEVVQAQNEDISTAISTVVSSDTHRSHVYELVRGLHNIDLSKASTIRVRPLGIDITSDEEIGLTYASEYKVNESETGDLKYFSTYFEVANKANYNKTREAIQGIFADETSENKLTGEALDQATELVVKFIKDLGVQKARYIANGAVVENNVEYKELATKVLTDISDEELAKNGLTKADLATLEITKSEVRLEKDQHKEDCWKRSRITQVVGQTEAGDDIVKIIGTKYSNVKSTFEGRIIKNGKVFRLNGSLNNFDVISPKTDGGATMSEAMSEIKDALTSQEWEASLSGGTASVASREITTKVEGAYTVFATSQGVSFGSQEVKAVASSAPSITAEEYAKMADEAIQMEMIAKKLVDENGQLTEAGKKVVEAMVEDNHQALGITSTNNNETSIENEEEITHSTVTTTTPRHGGRR